MTDIHSTLLTARTNTDESLAELSTNSPLLLMFLRQFGCAFCRESMVMLGKVRAQIEQSGTKVALIHQATDESAAAMLANYGLESTPRISDPDLRLYRAFGLGKMSKWSLLNPMLWLRGTHLAIVKKRGFGKVEGSETQMPGAFLIHQGRIVRSHVYKEVWDHPDFLQLARVK